MSRVCKPLELGNVYSSKKIVRRVCLHCFFLVCVMMEIVLSLNVTIDNIYVIRSSTFVIK